MPNTKKKNYYKKRNYIYKLFTNRGIYLYLYIYHGVK